MSESYYWILVQTNDPLNQITTSITKCPWGWWGYGTNDHLQLYNLAGLVPCRYETESSLEKYAQRICKYELVTNNNKIKVCVNPFIYPPTNTIITVGNWHEALSLFNNWLGSCVISLPRLRDWNQGIKYTQDNIFVHQISNYEQKNACSLQSKEIEYVAQWWQKQIAANNELLITTLGPLFNVHSSYDLLGSFCVLRQLWIQLIDTVIECFQQQNIQLARWNSSISPFNEYLSITLPNWTSTVTKVYLTYDLDVELPRIYDLHGESLTTVETMFYDFWKVINQALTKGQLNIPMFIRLINGISFQIKRQLQGKISKSFIPAVSAPQCSTLNVTQDKVLNVSDQHLVTIAICWSLIEYHLSSRLKCYLPIDISWLLAIIKDIERAGNTLCRQLSYPIHWDLSSLLKDLVQNLDQSSLALSLVSEYSLPASSSQMQHQYDRIKFLYDILAFWVQQIEQRTLYTTVPISEYLQNIGYPRVRSKVDYDYEHKIWGQLNPRLDQLEAYAIQLHEIIDKYESSIQTDSVPHFRMDQLYQINNQQLACLGLTYQPHRKHQHDESLSTVCVWQGQTREGYKLLLSDDKHYYLSLKNPCLEGLSITQLVEILEYLDTVANGEIVFDTVRRKITDLLADKS